MNALDPILYPAIEPYQSEYLAVSSLHQLYVEQCGNPQGLPVLFVHGGPGGGCEAMHRRYFDPTPIASSSSINAAPDGLDHFEQPDFALAFARIECHYFIHDSLLKPDQLLRDVQKIRHLPGVIIQGHYDVVCPTRSAWDLHRA